MIGLTINHDLCCHCGTCIASCPFSALREEEGRVVVGAECRLCRSCVEVCPVSAITVDEGESRIDLSGWRGILVYLQLEEGKLHPVSLEMLGLAHDLACQSGDPIFGVAVGPGSSQAGPALRGCNITQVLYYEGESFDTFRSDAYAAAIIDCIQFLRPSIVLFGATLEGRALAPQAAVRFQTGLTADCTSLFIGGEGNLVQVRPAFGGNIMAQIVTKHSRPQLVTVRHKVMRPVTPHGDALPTLLPRPAPEAALACPAQVLEQCREGTPADITEARVLLAIGKGVASKEDNPLFAEYARKTGGMRASSRALVEKGWMPIDTQIGLSGKAVSPDLLITCGVSGSVQFQAGIRGAKYIVAINSDENAQILSLAHLPLCGDMYEILPRLIERLDR